MVDMDRVVFECCVCHRPAAFEFMKFYQKPDGEILFVCRGCKKPHIKGLVELEG